MHITSAVLAGTGAVIILTSIYQGMHARQTAEKWLHVEKDVSQYVSKDEFAVVDNLRIIGFFAFVIGVSLMGLAKIGCMSSWKKNVTYTNTSYKRSIVRTLFVFFVALIIRWYAVDVKKTVDIHAKMQGKAMVNSTESTTEVNGNFSCVNCSTSLVSTPSTK